MFTLTHFKQAVQDDIQPSSSLINMPMVDYPDMLTYTASDAQYHAKIITPKYFSAAGYIDYLRDSLDKIKFVDQRAVYELVDLPMVKVIKEVTAAPLQIEETKTIIKTVGMTSQYIYLLQEREFVNSKQNIYKIGMTCQENHKRFNQYKKGSILLFQMICTDCRLLEKNIIKIFKEKFKQRKEDVGRESFEGDFKHMIDIIYHYVHQKNQPTADLLSEDLSDRPQNIIPAIDLDLLSENLLDGPSKNSSSNKTINHEEYNKLHISAKIIIHCMSDYKNKRWNFGFCDVEYDFQVVKKCQVYTAMDIEDIRYIVSANGRFNDLKMHIRERLGQPYPFVSSNETKCNNCAAKYVLKYNICKCECKCSQKMTCDVCKKNNCHKKRVKHLRFEYDARDDPEPNILNMQIINLFQDELAKKIAILSHKGTIFLYELSESQYKCFFDETKEKWYKKARTIRYGGEIQCDSITPLGYGEGGTVDTIASIMLKYLIIK
jgi:hypothetical protein